jgi:hypothetical protein
MSPTFLCIGGQRCGTTWLHEALKRCPHIHVAEEKETDFFNRKIFREDLAYYERCFERPKGAPAAAVRGEVSPNYCMLKRPGIELIRKLYPDLRLVLILRHPVERSISQAWLDLCYMRFQDHRPVRGWEYLLHAERQRTRRRSLYPRIIRDWRAVFGHEALHVCLYDDLVADPRGFYREVLRHIRADDRPLPDDLAGARVFAGRLPPPPPVVRWYYAREYRESVAELNDMLGGRVTGWLRDIDATLADGRGSWRLLRQVNKGIFSVPEKLAYAAYDWWRDRCYLERAEVIRRQRDEQRTPPIPAPKRRTTLITG